MAIYLWEKKLKKKNRICIKSAENVIIQQHNGNPGSWMIEKWFNFLGGYSSGAGRFKQQLKLLKSIREPLFRQRSLVSAKPPRANRLHFQSRKSAQLNVH